jgi:hypothetical protein
VPRVARIDGLTTLRPTAGFISAAVIAVACVGLAFAVAPRACQGGFEVYFWSGCAALLLLCALPFATHIGRSLLVRLAWATLFLSGGVAAWLVGLFGANVRFICSLGYL